MSTLHSTAAHALLLALGVAFLGGGVALVDRQFRAPRPVERDVLTVELAINQRVIGVDKLLSGV